MLSNEEIAAIYDFENVLESGLQALFAESGIKSFTTQDFGRVNADGTPVIDFQKDRPRVEIAFTPGPGQGQFRPLTIDDVEVPVETSFKGRFTLDIVTGADIKIHAAYRATVRAYMHTRLLAINGVDPMTFHRVQRFHQDGGTSPTFKPEDGYLRTILNFDIDFSIQNEAWPVPAEAVESGPILDEAGNPILDESEAPILSE